MTCGVYRLTFPNGKFYIGSSKKVEGRIKGHITALLNNRHDNPRMQNSFNKTPGEITGRLILRCAEADLLKYEQELMDEMQPQLNMSRIAVCPEWTPKKRAAQAIRMREKMKGNTYGKIHKGQKRPEIAKSMMGKRNGLGNKSRTGQTWKHSDETRTKISESAKKLWQQGNYDNSFHIGHKYNLGRKHTPEALEKMKIARNNRPPISDETRARMCAGQTRRRHLNLQYLQK